MKLAIHILFFVAMLLGVTEASAQNNLPNPCGKIPEFDKTIQNQDELKVDLQGKAEALKKFFGSADLSTQIEKDKKTIYESASASEAARSFAYYQYVVCVMIFNDDTFTIQQRLKAWKDAQRAGETGQIDSPEPCQSIDGTWSDSDRKITIQIIQKDCKINGTYRTSYLPPAFPAAMSQNIGIGLPVDNQLAGNKNGDNFDFTISSTTSSGCTFILYGRFTAIEQKQMTQYINRSSGQCYIPPNYTETRTWVRL